MRLWIKGAVSKLCRPTLYFTQVNLFCKTPSTSAKSFIYYGTQRTISNLELFPTVYNIPNLLNCDLNVVSVRLSPFMCIFGMWDRTDVIITYISRSYRPCVLCDSQHAQQQYFSTGFALGHRLYITDSWPNQTSK